MKKHLKLILSIIASFIILITLLLIILKHNKKASFDGSFEIIILNATDINITDDFEKITYDDSNILYLEEVGFKEGESLIEAINEHSKIELVINQSFLSEIITEEVNTENVLFWTFYINGKLSNDAIDEININELNGNVIEFIMNE